MAFSALECYCLIIGNERSGSTILGSIIDAHPNAVIANETKASQNIWRGLSKESILNEVIENACLNYERGRPSSGYKYQIGNDPSSKELIKVYGDKIWNPATLLLHGDYKLIGNLEKLLESKIKLIAAVRNPFDTISTMHKRSSAPILDRARWYFAHCEAISSLQERLPSSTLTLSYHESLIKDPIGEIGRICNFLDLYCDANYLKNTSEFLFKRPTNRSSEISWKPEEINEILAGINRHSFLANYRNSAPNCN